MSLLREKKAFTLSFTAKIMSWKTRAIRASDVDDNPDSLGLAYTEMAQ